ncbi:transcription termination factor 2-like [Onthophagus taurus]|uniref:transcription termination factor 2-like n=1 Tax=Onthophagus taurus TaxID=166361 RepID=UPI0039BE1624
MDTSDSIVDDSMRGDSTRNESGLIDDSMSGYYSSSRNSMGNETTEQSSHISRTKKESAMMLSETESSDESNVASSTNSSNDHDDNEHMVRNSMEYREITPAKESVVMKPSSSDVSNKKKYPFIKILSGSELSKERSKDNIEDLTKDKTDHPNNIKMDTSVVSGASEYESSDEESDFADSTNKSKRSPKTTTKDEENMIDNSTRDVTSYAKNSEIMEQSSFFGVRRKKKIAIIDSDATESDSSEDSSEESSDNPASKEENIIVLDESKTRSSNEDKVISQSTSVVDFNSSESVSTEVSNPPSPEFFKGPSSRISENFKSLKSSLCSTMIGNDLEVLSEDESTNVIELSDEDPVPISTKPKTFQPEKPAPPPTMEATPERVLVTKAVYDDQKRIVTKLQQDLAQVNNVFRTVDLSKLPDKGKLMRGRVVSIESSLKIAKDRLDKMVIDAALQDANPSNNKATWEDMKIQSDVVQPKTFGRQAISTYNTQKSLTMERLQQLHGSLSNCPKEDFLADDPKGLKISLMPHQKHAVAWLSWREQQQPSGGILADDMGLGKTLTMISLMLKSIESAPDRDENEWKSRQKAFVHGGTLIVCPASLVKQWEAEVSKHCKRGLVNIECYHGPKRETRATTLAKYDMVITTYTICQNEASKSTPLFRINWRRVILDEGHQIRNHKSQTAAAACQLEARSRWVLTGTPVHNKELDMYSLMKFLRCTPFDDYGIWKTWISNKDTGGYQRLQTVIASLMLRRTKAQLQEKGALQSLPERIWKVVEVKLSEDETAIYEKVLIFSRTIFAQYLSQRSNKGRDWNVNERPTVTKPIQPGNPYYKIYEKMSRRCKEVKQHEILMVLLRLRQCCCHPSLISQMLENADLEEEEDDGVMNLMEELEKLDLENDQEEKRPAVKVEVTKKFSSENPLFSSDYKSKKVEMILKTINEIVNEKKEKVIIVSQWTSFLRLVAKFLKEEGIKYEQLDGTLKIDKRMEIVQNINNSSHPTRVLLLSLTAGGVGLNLVGANHLLLVDIHWNPQLESQAQDRIYRVGQKRPVYIYKFITNNTIEEQVKNIQDYKLSIANSMLTGSKVEHTKLSLQDLRVLFNM